MEVAISDGDSPDTVNGVKPVRDGKRLAAVPPYAVGVVLRDVGVAAADNADERSRMSDIAFGRTRVAACWAP